MGQTSFQPLSENCSDGGQRHKTEKRKTESSSVEITTVSDVSEHFIVHSQSHQIKNDVISVVPHVSTDRSEPVK